MFYLLGIDDTDGKDFPPTHNLAYKLGLQLQSLSLANLINLSIHQLYQFPSIPYTSSNTSSCLLLDLEPVKAREVELVCREVLLRNSAPGSNAGFALASWSQYDPEIMLWGKSAKTTRLERPDAIKLARSHQISTAGLLGNGTGIIGALAAVGLRFDGSDGWIEWMPGLENIQGIYTQAQLNQVIHLDRIESEHQKRPALDDRIQISSPVRLLLRDGKIVLPVTPAKRGAGFEWQSVDLTDSSIPSSL